MMFLWCSLIEIIVVLQDPWLCCLWNEYQCSNNHQAYLMYLRETRAPHAISAYHEGCHEGVDIKHDCNPAYDAIVHAIKSSVESNETKWINIKPRSRFNLLPGWVFDAKFAKMLSPITEDEDDAYSISPQSSSTLDKRHNLLFSWGPTSWRALFNGLLPSFDRQSCPRGIK